MLAREDDEDLTCAVCFHDTSDRVSPCLHRVCTACVCRWCSEQREPECPLCRQLICGMAQTEQTEGVADDDDVSESKRIVVSMRQGLHVGITLQKKIGERGCVVKRVTKEDQAAKSGVTANQVIRSVNGISLEFVSHEAAISMIDTATLHGKSIVFVATQKPRQHCHWSAFFGDKARRSSSVFS